MGRNEKGGDDEGKQNRSDAAWVSWNTARESTKAYHDQSKTPQVLRGPPPPLPRAPVGIPCLATFSPQMGSYQDDPLDYHSRTPKKLRKNTLAEEWMATQPDAIKKVMGTQTQGESKRAAKRQKAEAEAKKKKHKGSGKRNTLFAGRRRH
eukprot:TRINITY_DN67328_c6_g1_i1.p2 TRINITY_DN67328_c6_g1~~TRINITY_DN67328_c6_g1_i1.p2  ORF type:complete len:150 (+),score=17.67 TRINITY_DN67328_c6_g1_i1:166-615(+)